MVGTLEDVTGHGNRPPAAATEDEVTGLLGSWAAVESHAVAGKLAAIREIIRRHGGPTRAGHVEMCPGDLPAQWDIGVAHEVAASLGISWQAADPLVAFAWDMEARLRGTGRLLDQGALSSQKAKIVSDEFEVLDDADVERAERELLGRILNAKGRLLDGMTPGKIRRICQQIVCTTDPRGAAKRREAAERDDARVEFYRNHGGAGALFASGLPADEALRSEANIAKRAKEYRAAGIYPSHSMDMLRVLALIDTINGRSLEQRIATWRAERDEAARRAGHPAEPDEPGDDDADEDADDNDLDSGGPHDGDGAPGGDEGDDGDDHSDGEDGDPGGDGGGPGGGDDGGDDWDGSPAGGGVPAGKADPGLPSLANLTLPLATLLGLADRPGEAPGYGALDPDLARKLAATAAASPRTRFCLTITDRHGYAAAHGCARLIRGTGQRQEPGQPPSRDGPPPGGWDLVPDPGRPGPDGGYGAWILTVPDGRRYRIDLHTIPVEDCDHAYETDGYRPSRLLRHLVEIRDGECTSVACSMPARQCDFEHAVPYDQGGRTDACNAGARSRRCHQVKQSQNWEVTQPKPGWHQWIAPSGRTYIKGPMRYPA
jgi:hypothetical protein